MNSENLKELQRLLAKRKMVNCWLEADLIVFFDNIEATKKVQISDIKKAFEDFYENSMNTNSCDYYSWNRKYHHIEDLLKSTEVKA